jgi:hypothetical protein
MENCPNCHRKLVSHASAKCNWCGATIDDPAYQSAASASRDAYFAEETAHDEASVANFVLMGNANPAGLHYIMAMSRLRQNQQSHAAVRAAGYPYPPAIAAAGHPPQQAPPRSYEQASSFPPLTAHPYQMPPGGLPYTHGPGFPGPPPQVPAPARATPEATKQGRPIPAPAARRNDSRSDGVDGRFGRIDL